jgi:hypothetical protein
LVAWCAVAAADVLKPGTARGAQPDDLAAIYSGAWHLGFAQGRSACAPRNRPFTSELRALMQRDLDEVRRGLEGLASCRDASGQIVAHAIDGLPGATALATPPDADVLLDRLGREYLVIVRSSPCSGGTAMRLDTLCGVGLRVGSAAARVQCAISTWDGPLGVAVAREVREDLDAARLALAGLELTTTRSEGLAGLDLLSRRLDGARGEEIYETLVRLSGIIQSSLLRRPSKMP